jgi:glyoxylase-like metal-dependent hydrolase (beta-lactamase superfamily II)
LLLAGGAVRITRVQELEAPGMRFIVPQATLENVAEIPWLTPFLAANGDAMGSVHALVLEVADQRIIVDTCIGNDKERRIPTWHKRQGPFLTQLTAAGYPPESFNTVICTHLHTDHVGWNTRLVEGQWVPTFPQARYLVASRIRTLVAERGPDPNRVADSVRPLFGPAWSSG